MAYNLPPPWDPGFALPDNVRDEGLQRRGLVTKQMPRGTYDRPNVDTGGYVVPQYIMDEGYGQGTFTTKWEPGGTYDGPRIRNWLNDRPRVLSETRRRGGGRNITIAAPIMVQPYDQGATAMSGLPEEQFSPAIITFGLKAADRLCAYAASVPKELRTQALRSAMDGIDKTLWDRTKDIAKQLVSQGATPGQAFRPALARALSAGVAASLIRVGETSAVPQSGPLRGLGCNGGRRAALGATMISVGKGTNTMTSGSTSLEASYVRCPGFSWDGKAWVRTKAGQTDVMGPPGGCAAPTDVRDQRHPDEEKIQVGPFVFPMTLKAEDIEGDRGAHSLVLSRYEDITPEWWGIIRGAALKGGLCKYTLDTLKTDEGQKRWGPWFKAMGIANNQTFDASFLGMCPTIGQGAYRYWRPVAATKHPITGEDLGVYVRIEFLDPNKPWAGVTASAPNPVVMRLYLIKILKVLPDGWGDLWDWIVHVASSIYNFVGDLICDLVNTPGASTAAATMGPNGLVAGVGMEIIKGTACQRPIPPPPPPPIPLKKPFPILPVAIAGAAVLAVVVLSSKPKKKHP